MQWLLVALVGLGLLLIAIGGAMINLGNNPDSPNQAMVRSYGPLVIDFGLFLLIAGLLLGAMILENMDVFIRLFLLILAFVALLMILASPFSYFAAPFP